MAQATWDNGCLEAPCNLGFQFSDIRVVANSEFLKDNPAVAKLFEVVEIPLGDIAAQNNKMNLGEDSADDIRHHAMRIQLGDRRSMAVRSKISRKISAH